MIWNILFIIITIYALYLTIAIILMNNGLKDAIENLTLDNQDIVTNSKEYIKMSLNSLFEYTMLMPLCMLTCKIIGLFEKDE